MPSPRSGGISAAIRGQIGATSEKPPCQKWREEMPLKKLLKGGWQEAFLKDSDLVQWARKAYFRTTHPDFNHEASLDLSLTFCEMAHSAGLHGSSIYEVKDVWAWQKDLHTANHAAKTLQKNIQFFCLVSLSASLSIMRLEGIHSSEALHLRHGLSYSPWCGKGWQNEGRMVNHLHTIHYCLGLACTLCLAFFTSSVDTMRKHGVHCKASHTKNQEEEETSEGGNNDEDDEFLP